MFRQSSSRPAFPLFALFPLSQFLNFKDVSVPTPFWRQSIFHGGTTGKEWKLFCACRVIVAGGSVISLSAFIMGNGSSRLQAGELFRQAALSPSALH